MEFTLIYPLPFSIVSKHVMQCKHTITLPWYLSRIGTFPRFVFTATLPFEQLQRYGPKQVQWLDECRLDLKKDPDSSSMYVEEVTPIIPKTVSPTHVGFYTYYEKCYCIDTYTSSPDGKSTIYHHKTYFEKPSYIPSIIFNYVKNWGKAQLVAKKQEALHDLVKIHATDMVSTLSNASNASNASNVTNVSQK